MKTTKREKMLFTAEYTDTFGGEANYSWVRRYDILIPTGCSRRSLIMAAKKAAGLTGARGRTTDYGDSVEFRPFGCCTVLFVNPVY